MARMKQVRSKELSLWQSAADEVVAKESAGSQALSANSRAAIRRPDQNDNLVAAANDLAESLDQGESLPETPQAVAAATLDVGDVAKFCSVTALKLARARVKAILTGNDSDVRKFEAELGTQFGQCDPRWAQVIAVYVANRTTQGPIPYRRHTQLSDFVIDGQLPDNAKIALFADWGTGQDPARFLLKQIASKNPDVVIHLGDVYYSGAEHEFQNYFYKIWQQALKLPKVKWGAKLAAPSQPATFTLSGNHDMYAGGGPYYTTIDMLGQPASYFCLRNDKWQFIALDTGLHDAAPVGGSTTFLEDSEVEWLKDKIQNAGGRKTVLLSHHQLFSAYEDIGPAKINQRLLDQVKDILPQVTAWFWGHEHNLVIFDKFQNVLARCIGHGAFPVGVDEMGQPDPAVPIQAVTLAPDRNGGLLQHGYALIDLNGGAAKATYFQYDALSQQEQEFPINDVF
jgi:3',5'-cyclic AMP phosphodiesterase CpdA